MRKLNLNLDLFFYKLIYIIDLFQTNYILQIFFTLKKKGFFLDIKSLSLTLQSTLILISIYNFSSLVLISLKITLKVNIFIHKILSTSLENIFYLTCSLLINLKQKCID